MNVLAFCPQPIWDVSNKPVLSRIADGEEWHRIPIPEHGETVNADQCESCGNDSYVVLNDSSEPQGLIVECDQCGYSCVVESLNEMLVVW